jgi:exopolyphosphatase/guanosine-5'-triphosphate,3'-diphosphate pyrophosphatase
VNTTLRFFGDDRIDRARMRRAQVACAAEIEEAIAGFARPNWDEAFGSSGTIGAVSEMLRAQGWTDGTITSEGLLKLRQALMAAGEIKRIRIAGLKADRQEVIAGGVAVLSAVFDTLGVTSLRTARGALRVGLLYDLLGRRESRDLRDATVERLQARFGVDRAQAQRVGALATQFFDALKPNADEQLLKRLAWASALHEIGFAISHGDYHKHGGYMVQHGDLAGFSTSDQERIAQLIVGQRGNLKKVAAVLEDPDRAAKILALRLAVILCHARRDVQPPRWSLRYARGAIDLGLDSAWLERHPLTAHLLDEEAAQWARLGTRFNLKPL